MESSLVVFLGFVLGCTFLLLCASLDRGHSKISLASKDARPECVFDGKSFEESQVKWVLSLDIPRLDFDHCIIRRISHAEATSCLAGKSLVFLGDSVTRYQYLSLAYFIEGGRYPPPTCGWPGNISPVEDQAWGNWTHMFQGTNAALNGREICDCYRPHDIPSSQITENRYYSGDANLTYLTHFAYEMGMHGHHKPGDGFNYSCPVGKCSGPHVWSYPKVEDALADFVPRLTPDFLVFNIGLWTATDTLGDETIDTILKHGAAAVAERNGRVFWKTTTALLDNPTMVAETKMLSRAHGHGWDILDAWTVTRQLGDISRASHTDAKHFKGFVYEEINNLMLNMMCHVPSL